MTTPDPTTDATESIPAATELTDTTSTTSENIPDDKEAARYRRRLRDTETERDTLAGRVETLQRAEAERLAGEHLANGADLWLTGTQLADLLDDAGNLDPAKITTTAQTLGNDRPHWRRTAAAAANAGEVTARGKIDGGPNRTWSEVLRGE